MLPLDVIRNIIWLFKIIVIIFISGSTKSQRLPARNDRFIHNPNDRDIFYDTQLLPDGSEVTVYLLKGEIKKYFFIIGENNKPFTIYITPCASPIRWTIYWRKYDPVYGKLSPRDPAPTQGPLISKASYTGEETSKYSSENNGLGVFMVELNATASDSLVKLFAKTISIGDGPYPKLPSKKTVDISSVEKKKFSFSWKNSPSEKYNTNLEYCVAISRKRGYKTHCSVTSHYFGDVIPTLPPDYGFGFSSEKAQARHLKRNSKPIKPAKSGRIFYTCIGQTTQYTYKKARPGRVYNINVYVVDKTNNRSSSYDGHRIKTKRDENSRRLRNGGIKRFTLKRTSNSRDYRFKVRKPLNKLYIALQLCGGSVRLEVTKGGKIVLKAKIRKTRELILKNLQKDNYIFRVSGTGRKRRSVSLYVGTDSVKKHLPKLPKDTQIKEFESLTSCNALTLAWMGTDKKQKYCLFIREISPSKRRKPPNLNNCPEKQSKSKDRVICKNFRHKDIKTAVVMQKVNHLKPGTEYVFDVFVSRRKGLFLSYRSLWTKTKDTC